MKKFLAILLAAMMIFALISCGTQTQAPAETGAAPAAPAATGEAGEETDSAYVVANGKLVVGITDFEPMDYKDENGEWIGFDADLAKAFAEYLGVKVEFVEINWDNKVLELSGKNIDCVWNGMTIREDLRENMDITNAYMNNAQVVIVSKDKADSIKTVEDCKELKFAVESGSAGQEVAAENSFTFTEFTSQADALMEVAAGTSDAAIIDSLMAGAMVGEGTAYEGLTATVKLNSEEYGVGFRKGSDLTEKLNEFFTAQASLIKELAEKYGVQEALIG